MTRTWTEAERARELGKREARIKPENYIWTAPSRPRHVRAAGIISKDLRAALALLYALCWEWETMQSDRENSERFFLACVRSCLDKPNAFDALNELLNDPAERKERNRAMRIARYEPEAVARINLTYQLFRAELNRRYPEFVGRAIKIYDDWSFSVLPDEKQIHAFVVDLEVFLDMMVDEGWNGFR